MGAEKLPGIQAARAIAALSILYFHSWVALTRFPEGSAYPIPVWKTYGWLGVDLFFAISGFVIGLVASRRQFDPASFLLKRVFRIFPLWLLTLSLFAAAAMLWRGPTETETPTFFLYSMTLLPMNGFPFYPIGWSLQHEMIFYVMAAAIIPFFGISALVAILLVSYIAFQTIDMPWYVATLANHHGEFLAGLLAFLTYKRLAWLGATLPVAVGFVALLSLAYFERSQLFPFPLYVVIVGFANWRSQSSFLALAGDASYSIYLIHPIIFMAASAIVSKIPFAIWAQEPIRFGCISVVVLTSIASWKWFEIPILEFAGRIRNAKLAELPTK